MTMTSKTMEYGGKERREGKEFVKPTKKLLGQSERRYVKRNRLIIQWKGFGLPRSWYKNLPIWENAPNLFYDLLNFQVRK